MKIVLLLLAIGACRSPVASTLKEDTAEAQELEEPAPTIVELVTRPDTGERVFVPTPLIAQQRNYTCGMASLMSVLQYYGDWIREGQLQRLMRSDRNNGTSYTMIAKFLDTLNNLAPAKRKQLMETAACEEDYAPADYAKCKTGIPSASLQAANAHRKVKARKAMVAMKYDVVLRPGISQDWYPDSELGPLEQGTKVPRDGWTLVELEASLRAKKPVIVLIQAYTDGNPLDQATWGNDEHGHYVVATGFDAKNIYVMDPTTIGAWAYVSKKMFVQRWHDVDTITNADGTTKDTLVRHFGLQISREDRGPDPMNFGAMTVPRLD